ncbi:MAG: protein phosphatase 2C domain-containing protein [Bilifractor sp.]
MNIIDFTTFREVTQGYLHIARQIGCEDYADTWSDPSGQFHIAAIADGHGDPTCVRSARGARFAVEVALACLQKFAKSYLPDGQEEQLAQEDRSGQSAQPAQEGWHGQNAQPAQKGLSGLKKQPEQVKQSGQKESSDREKQNTPDEQNTPDGRYEKNDIRDLLQPRTAGTELKRLTDTMLMLWRMKCQDDLHEAPLTDAELEAAGMYADYYTQGSELAHAYGTTLIAALMTQEALILLQQGDGRCEVIFADGTIDQPIPWDSRCHENVTTSLSDPDAAESFRHAVIDLSKDPVCACFLGSDGVEDSFDDMDGTHAFYISLAHEIGVMPGEEFQTYLHNMLPGFTRKGSGDDVSVAGIVCAEALGQYRENFEEILQRYRAVREAEEIRQKLHSMERKHRILRERMEQTGEDTDAEAFRRYDARYQELEQRYNALRGTSVCKTDVSGSSGNMIKM